jgi:hypothetical protein
MNKEQLEKISIKIDEIREIFEEDIDGGYEVKQCIEKFDEVVKKELKEIVWKMYLAEKTKR